MSLFVTKTKSKVTPSIVINVLDAEIINHTASNDIETQEEDPVAKEMKEKKVKAKNAMNSIKIFCLTPKRRTRFLYM